jgi:hypothetical protein
MALDLDPLRRMGAGDPAARAGVERLQEGESPAVREVDSLCHKQREG